MKNKNKQNYQNGKAKNCGNKNCGKNNAQNENGGDNHSYSHGGNND